MTWPDFVENVVKVAKITKENLGPVIADMKWSFQKKTGLPLMDVTGFQTMLQQVRGLEDIDSAIILIALPPSASRHPRKALKMEGNQEIFLTIALTMGQCMGRR